MEKAELGNYHSYSFPLSLSPSLLTTALITKESSFNKDKSLALLLASYMQIVTTDSNMVF